MDRTTTLEEWRNIKNTSNHYQVSNLGRVRSVDKMSENSGGAFLRKGRVLKGCVIKTGYHTVTIRVDNEFKTQITHRLVGQAFLENKDNKPEINHKDGVKTNNVLENLEWATGSENCLHSARTKIFIRPKGEKAGASILTTKEVLFIKSKKGIVNQKELAKLFSVDPSTISSIFRGRTWKHLDEHW